MVQAAKLAIPGWRLPRNIRPDLRIGAGRVLLGQRFLNAVLHALLVLLNTPRFTSVHRAWPRRAFAFSRHHCSGRQRIVTCGSHAASRLTAAQRCGLLPRSGFLIGRRHVLNFGAFKIAKLESGLTSRTCGHHGRIRNGRGRNFPFKLTLRATNNHKATSVWQG